MDFFWDRIRDNRCSTLIELEQLFEQIVEINDFYFSLKRMFQSEYVRVGIEAPIISIRFPYSSDSVKIFKSSDSYMVKSSDKPNNLYPIKLCRECLDNGKSLKSLFELVLAINPYRRGKLMSEEYLAPIGGKIGSQMFDTLITVINDQTDLLIFRLKINYNLFYF